MDFQIFSQIFRSEPISERIGWREHPWKPWNIRVRSLPLWASPWRRERATPASSLGGKLPRSLHWFQEAAACRGKQLPQIRHTFSPPPKKKLFFYIFRWSRSWGHWDVCFCLTCKAPCISTIFYMEQHFRVVWLLFSMAWVWSRFIPATHMCSFFRRQTCISIISMLRHNLYCTKSSHSRLLEDTPEAFPKRLYWLARCAFLSRLDAWRISMFNTWIKLWSITD